jgi:hypothetical protein
MVPSLQTVQWCTPLAWHIPSTPKLQVQLRILEMRVLLQQARSKVDAAATAAAAGEEQSQAAAGVDAASAIERLERQLVANTAVAGDRMRTRGSARGAGAELFAVEAAAATPSGRRTVTARRSARLAEKQGAAA